MSVLQKNKKVAAGIGVAAAAAAVLALGAGTYAAFSDTETVPNTTFAAGSLNLVVGGSVTTAPFAYNDLKPGSVIDESISVDNAGTLDGKLTFAINVSGAENTCVEPETDREPGCSAASELTSALLVSVNNAPAVPLSSFPASFDASTLPAAGDPVTVPIRFTVDPNAGNEIMTDSTTVSFTATLTQL